MKRGTRKGTVSSTSGRLVFSFLIIAVVSLQAGGLAAEPNDDGPAPTQTRKKIGLVLSGGGARGLAGLQVGGGGGRAFIS